MLGALVGSFLLWQRLRQITLDLEPAEVAALAVGQGRLLQTVRDRVIGLDATGNITLANSSAAETLGLTHLPLPVQQVWPELARLPLPQDAELRQFPLALTQTTTTQATASQTASQSAKVMRLNITPLGGGSVLVAFNEWQEEARLAEELTHTRTLVDTMRARAHEYGNRLHVVASFLQLGQPERALKVIQDELETETALSRALSSIAEPRIAALLAGKMARARELRLSLHLLPGSELPPDLPPLTPRR